MFGYLSDLERTFAAMDELRRRVGRTVDGNGFRVDAFATDAAWPRTSVYENETGLTLVADVPGLRESDLELSLDKDVLTLGGERKLAVPEKHTVHRQERRGSRFQRQFTLPYKVNADAMSAELKDGVLTVKLPKAPEAQPRKIAVKVARSVDG
jgi:HSP20 family protein